ncbi:hypothetical protein SeMB42_g02217 [Synchytrium endobioticum]|uniref:Uncharacterized protein n=1 Tax=Synchytrium endobioticum TaxID=286115 RepID=A0A507DG36_9FUNG|nr:hypothetical protein SeLEV6574_g03166 [Synchytrium endobioticum]TPX46555.1 hypothetical protein SeLEV6574_g03175 [Synchytrium endobioticum]TPX50496.1 hypothetical protein SeMB42_g02217 [Synchytrium endobioticum]
MPASQAQAQAQTQAHAHHDGDDATTAPSPTRPHPFQAAGPNDARVADPIIMQLLSTRVKMTDVSDAYEDERQRRMYNMLRHSHQYKRLQVRDANAKWGDDLAALDAALASESVIPTTAKPTTPDPTPLAVPLPAKRKDRRVSFCVDPPRVISLPSLPSFSDSEGSSRASSTSVRTGPGGPDVLAPRAPSESSDSPVQEPRRGKRRSSGTGPAWRVLKMLGWALVVGVESAMAAPVFV